MMRGLLKQMILLLISRLHREAARLSKVLEIHFVRGKTAVTLISQYNTVKAANTLNVLEMNVKQKMWLKLSPL